MNGAALDLARYWAFSNDAKAQGLIDNAKNYEARRQLRARYDAGEFDETQAVKSMLPAASRQIDARGTSRLTGHGNGWDKRAAQMPPPQHKPDLRVV